MQYRWKTAMGRRCGGGVPVVLAILAGLASPLPAQSVLLPGPWPDADQRHRPGEATGGSSWDYSYYRDLDSSGDYTWGDEVMADYAGDVNGNYRQDVDEEWPGVFASFDHSSAAAAASNMVEYGYGVARYEYWAYECRQGWTSQLAPDNRLQSDGYSTAKMEKGHSYYNWVDPIGFAYACLREGSPVALGYEWFDDRGWRYLSYATVWGIDREAGTMQITDARADFGGTDAATCHYTVSPDMETIALSGPINDELYSVTAFDVVSWWVAGPNDWNFELGWANKHVPTADQAVYLTHNGLFDINLSGAGRAKAIYIDSPGPTNRIALTGGADLVVSQSVVLGENRCGLIQESAGSFHVGSDLVLGQNAGSLGTYELRGGALWTNNTRVGDAGLGRFEQFGGSHDVQGMLCLGQSAGGEGSYRLEPAAGVSAFLEADVEIVGFASTGLFTHTGGVNRVGRQLVVGLDGQGTYNLSGTGTVLTDELVVGESAPGGFNQTGGSLTVGVDSAPGLHTAGGADMVVGTGATGAYNLAGGSLTTSGLVVGERAVGQMNQSAGAATVLGAMTVGLAASGAGTVEVTGGTLTTNELTIGHAGSGELRLGSAGGAPATVQVNGGGYVGFEPGSTGTITMRAGADLRIGGTLHVGRTKDLGGEPAPTAAVRMLSSAARISATNADAHVIVHGARATITGQGWFHPKMTFESDPLFGPTGDRPVSVTFAPNSLTQASALRVQQGLTETHAGSAENVQFMSGWSLPGSSYHLGWGDPFDWRDPQKMTYTLEHNGTRLARPMPTVPYNPAGIRGTASIPVDRVATRLRLWQFRDGMVRNATLYNENGAPVLDSVNHTISGASQHKLDHIFQGTPRLEETAAGYDLVVGGVAVDPVHQNPQIAALHARGLTGKGVRIGEIEGSVPYRYHGEFADWSVSDPTALRLFVPEDADGGIHATQVAAIMVGYDPMGLQVTNRSSLRGKEYRYGTGLGFTGAAPGAQLWSKAFGNGRWSKAIELTTELAVSDHVDIINCSFAFVEYPANGSAPLEKAHDYWAADHWAEEAAIRGHLTSVVGGRGIMFTHVAGNAGANPSTVESPAGEYNGLVVGAAEFDDEAHPTQFDAAAAKVASFSSRGPTADGRVGVSLLAQGVGNLTSLLVLGEQLPNGEYLVNEQFGWQSDAGLYGTTWGGGGTIQGTSYAAPTAAGVCALLMEQADLMGQPLGRSPLVLKSILMTSADPLAGWEKGLPGNQDDHVVPLDYAQGAGLMDPVGAVDLLLSNRQLRGPDPLDSNGWGWDVLFADEAQGHAWMLDGLQAGQQLVATLNWFRHVVHESGGGEYEASSLTDLELALYFADGSPVQIDWSDSPIDNVEHLRTTLPYSGSYFLQVSGDFAFDRLAEEYALSWQVVPEPSTWLMLVALAIACLAAVSRRHV